MNVTSLSHEIYVIIPMWNERATIRPLLEKVLKQIPNIIVVDDHSTDNSRELIIDLPITILHNERNMGKGASLAKGFTEAIKRGAKIVITLDADGQHDPNDISRLLLAATHYPQHLIIGARMRNRENSPKLRYFANRCGDFWISWTSGQAIIDTQSGFRLYPATFLRQVNLSYNKRKAFEYECELLIEAGKKACKIVAVPIDAYYPQHARASYFRPFIDIVKIIRVVLSKLMMQGFNLPGLYRSLHTSAIIAINGDNEK